MSAHTAPPTDVDERPPDPPPRPLEARDQRRRQAAAWLIPLILLAAAGLPRFYRLGEPDRIYFDETYYANDAHQYLTRGVEEGFSVHPPVGKWLLAGGIAIFGFDAFGWRFAAAVAGTLTVLALYLAGLRLFRHRGIAALAAFLLAVDGLAFTMSRIAMLDVFLGLFVVLGFWLLLVDRDRLWGARRVGRAGVAEPEAPASHPDTPAPVEDVPPRPGLPRISRRYLYLSGTAFGLALATKWSAIFAIAAAGAFLLGSELLWRRRVTGRVLAEPHRFIASGLVALVLLPAVIYVASYAGWFANFAETRVGQARCPGGVCNISAPGMVRAWWGEQGEIARFHRDLSADHPYRATARRWPTLERPVAYYYESCDAEKQARGECVVDEGNVAEILGMGNPAIWWLALPLYPLLVYLTVRDRDWRGAAILAFLLAQYLPWLIAERPLFMFYMVPVVPFICLTLAYVAWASLRQPLLRWVPAAMALVAAGGFLFWYPLFAGLEISRESWDFRIWRSSWI